MLHSIILLLPCFASLLGAGVLLLKREPNNRAQNILIIVTLLMGVSTCIWGLYFAGITNLSLFYKLEVLEAFTTLLLLPLLYFAFKALTGEEMFGWKDYLWLLPAFLIVAGMVTLYVIMGDAQAVGYIRELMDNEGNLVTCTSPVFRVHHFLSVYLYKIVVIAQIIYVLIYSTIRLMRYKHRLDEYFSTPEGRSVEYGRALLIGQYLVLMLSLCTYRGRFHYQGDSWFIEMVMLFWAVLICYMGYNAYHLRYTADSLALDLEEADREAEEMGCEPVEDEYHVEELKQLNKKDNPEGYVYAQAVLAKKEKDYQKKHQLLVERFETLMDQDKLFLQKELRMVDVARAMFTNRTYLSRMIGQEYKCTFYDCINKRRILYAQELARGSEKISVEQLSEATGFLHSSSFCRTFKQQMGITFKEWKQLPYQNINDELNTKE